MSMFFETADQSQGDVAAFGSPYSIVTNDTCLSFSYLMDEVPTDTDLNVYFFPASGDETLLWTSSGDKGSSWLTARLDLGALGEGYFYLEGKAGSSAAVIGLDDVLFGHCDNHPTSGIGGGSGQTSVGMSSIGFCVQVVDLMLKIYYFL